MKLYEDFAKSQAKKGVEDCVTAATAAEQSKRGSTHVFQVSRVGYFCFVKLYTDGFTSCTILLRVKGLLHCFSTCIEITRNNCYCLILKDVENCKKKFQRVKKL